MLFIIKLIITNISFIIFVKVLNFKILYFKRKSKDNLTTYSTDIDNFMKNKNKISHKKLAIVLPVDSDIYKKKIIYNTLASIFSLNYNYSLFLIYNKKCPKITIKNNIILKKEFFNNVFTAFNLIIDSINNFDYITFLTPGDLLKPSSYDFLNYIEEHDIYQIYGFNKTNLYEKKMIKEENYTNIRIYDFIKMMPNNNYVIYDKIYKISLLKNYNIKFILHEKSLYYFNLLSFSYAKDLLYIHSYEIMHNFQVLPTQIYDNKFQEAILFKRIILGNKTQTKKIIEDMNKIDYVFPYVTSDDPYWQYLYKLSLSGKESKYSTGIPRFRANGLLKYLFRSLEKYLPWINKVHMIVMSESQVPSWINRENVNIIYHSDFIPKKYLPTFSSSLIETFLPFLPFVEEKFIYGNDDLIPCRYLSKSFFFQGNIPCYNINIRDFLETAPGDSLRRNAFNIICEKKQNKRVATTQHSTISYRMPLIKNCFKKHKKIILNSLSKFREDKNLNQYMYAFYQMIEDTILNIPHKIGLYIVKPKYLEKIINKNFKKYDFVCLNDEFDMTEKDWNKILSKFKNLLPNKSKYEK